MTKKKKTYKEVLTPTVTEMSPGVMRVTLNVAEYEVATLYFERPKKTWTNKPIMPNVWTCVDAKIHEKFIYINGMVTPKELIRWGMDLIKEAGN